VGSASLVSDSGGADLCASHGLTATALGRLPHSCPVAQIGTSREPRQLRCHHPTWPRARIRRVGHRL